MTDSHLPGSLSRKLLLAVPIAVLAAMTGAWSQPPQPVEPGRITVEQLRQRFQTPPPVVLGPGNHAMRMVTPGGVGQQGALALSDKYVFVLLDGTLYQYDLDTLVLRNQVRVAPAREHQIMVTPNVVTRPAVIPPDPNRAWLGVSLRALPEGLAKQHGLKPDAGAVVTEVVVDSPADKAGLKAGDVIVGFDGEPVPSLEELVNRVRTTDVGKKVAVEILRDGKRRTVTVEMTKMPDLFDG